MKTARPEGMAAEWAVLFTPVALALACCATQFLIDGHAGFSLWDEGFLWYGAQRTSLGEVPMRDFMAYDAGRYLWSAALMRTVGNNGLVVVRIAATCAQALALTLGLLVFMRRSPPRGAVFWLVAALTWAVWMTPQFRLFDASCAIVLVSALAWLAAEPSVRRCAALGVTVGVVAIVGQNHGVYGAVGSVAMLVLLLGRQQSSPSFIRGTAAWAGGVVLGYLPMLLALLVVPGFGGAFVDVIRAMFARGATNIPRPVPWPWSAPTDTLDLADTLRAQGVGLLFIALAALSLGAVFILVRARRRGPALPPPLCAALVMVPPYAHYAFSRADVEHLALGMPPALMALTAWLATRPGRAQLLAACAALVASAFVVAPSHPGWVCRAEPGCMTMEVGRDRLTIDSGTAGNLRGLRKLVDAYAPGDCTFLTEPVWPGAYAAFSRRSPVWEIYALVPRSEAFQLAEIERLRAAQPGFAFVADFALDGRDELRFRNTHAVVDQFIQDNYIRLNGNDAGATVRIYRAAVPCTATP